MWELMLNVLLILVAHATLFNVKIQPNSVVDQAGDCLKDGGQDAEHSGAGNVKAARAKK